jgi:hypothetical protein
VKTLDASHVVIFDRQHANWMGHNMNGRHMVFESNDMNMTRRFCQHLFHKLRTEQHLTFEGAAAETHLSCRELHSGHPCSFFDWDTNIRVAFPRFDRIRRAYD